MILQIVKYASLINCVTHVHAFVVLDQEKNQIMLAGLHLNGVTVFDMGMAETWSSSIFN